MVKDQAAAQRAARSSGAPDLLKYSASRADGKAVMSEIPVSGSGFPAGLGDTAAQRGEAA